MNIEVYINSGILESYVLGIATEKEAELVEQVASVNILVKNQIDEIRTALENLVTDSPKKPSQTVKPLLLATIDYMERMKKGEKISNPPELNENALISDYKEWLEREDMILPGDFDGLYAKLIGHTGSITTAIVWIKEMAPEEIHDAEYERFLIIEGECDIVVNDKVNHLVPGNYFSIPLHCAHHVKVTSSSPCKVILQRIAA